MCVNPSSVSDIDSLFGEAAKELGIEKEQIIKVMWEKNKNITTQATRLIREQTEVQLSVLKESNGDQDLFVMVNESQSGRCVRKINNPSVTKMKKKKRAPHTELVDPQWKTAYAQLDSAASKTDSMCNFWKFCEI